MKTDMPLTMQAAGLLLILIVLKWWLQHRKTFAMARILPGINGLPLAARNIIDAIRGDLDVLKVIKNLPKYSGSDGFMKYWVLNDLVVTLTEPEHLQTFYNSDLLIDRSPEYHRLEPWIGDVNILSAHYNDWKKIRKMTVQTFNAMTQEDLVNEMSENAKYNVERLKDYSTNGWVELQDVFRMSNYRLFTKVALNEDIDNHPDLREVVWNSRIFAEVLSTRLTSPIHSSDFLFNFTKDGARFKKATEDLRRVVTQVVHDKKLEVEVMKKDGKTPPNLFVYNMLTKYADEPINDIVDQLISLYGAATDTTMSTNGFIMLMLAIHQDVQDKIFKEDAEIQARGSGKYLDSEEFNNYEFLDRVIKETLRLYPAFPIIGRLAADDVYIGKYLVPKGATVFNVPYLTHRRGDIFEDPMKFDPDRFLPERFQKIHPYAFTPFAAGIKNCVGIKFAMLSLKITVSTLVRHFKITSDYKSIDDLEKNVYCAINIQEKNGFRVRLEKR